MQQPRSPQMTKEMLKDFREFILANPEVEAEVIETSQGTYLMLGEIAPSTENGKEQYMILLTAERKQ
jgi:hypothetical protein